MSHHTWNYQEALRRQGFRVTPQRELILDLICQSRSRLTARELCDAARERAPGLNPATVYRNLRFLTQQHLVRAVERDGVVTYALAGPGPAHHHLVCSSCGAEVELPHEALAPAFTAIERTFGFAVESDHVLLFGRYAACRSAARSEAPTS